MPLVANLWLAPRGLMYDNTFPLEQFYFALYHCSTRIYSEVHNAYLTCVVTLSNISKHPTSITLPISILTSGLIHIIFMIKCSVQACVGSVDRTVNQIMKDGMRTYHNQGLTPNTSLLLQLSFVIFELEIKYFRPHGSVIKLRC